MELKSLLERARQVARTDMDVLISAESGTGKELLARLIHQASDRRNRAFVAVNCAALPESSLESELFGYARGAFTGAVTGKPGKFELAHTGNLLLDEIGEMPLQLQPKLLRVLQEREVDRLGETRTVRPVYGLIERPDGNNVSLDRESMLLAQTQLEYKAAIELIRAEFRRLLGAINDGKES